MKRTMGMRIRASALAGAALILGMPAAALAADAVAADAAVAAAQQQDTSGALTEIVVTAEKRPASLASP